MLSIFESILSGGAPAKMFLVCLLAAVHDDDFAVAAADNCRQLLLVGAPVLKESDLAAV